MADALPLAVHPVGLLRLEGLAGLELGVEEGLEPGHFGVDGGLVDHAFSDQPFGIDLARRLQGADLRIHQRLGEGRIVTLVVAEAAVAEHVHHHILVEFLPELRRHLGGEDHRFRIVAVDVEDRGLDHQGHVRRIGRGAAVPRAGREADLVVDDEMHRPAGAVTLQPHQGEAFGHHALAGEGGIAVDQQGHDLGAVESPGLLGPAGIGGANIKGLFRPRLAQHHRIDDLEVRRVGGQGQVDVVAVERPVRRGPHVVFDVARTLDVRGHGRAALEFVEDGAIGFAHHRRQGVQPPAVGHAQHDLVDAEGTAALDDLFQRRDHGLAAVQAEPLGAGEAFVQEAFETLGLDQLVEDGQLALTGESVLGEGVRTLETRLQPGLLFRLGDMHELDAERAAVGALQQREDLAYGAGLEAQHAVEEDRPVEVALAEAVEFGGQFRVAGRLLNAQRVEAGLQVTSNAIAADQHQRPDRIMSGRADSLRQDGGIRSGGQRRGGGRGAGLFGIGLRSGPAAVEHACRLGRLGRNGATPGTGGARGLHTLGIVPELVEEGAPFARDRRRIGGPFLVQILDERGVGAIQEAGLGKDLVQPTGIVRHCSRHVPEAARARLRATGTADIGGVSLWVMTEWGRKGQNSPESGEIRTLVVPPPGQNQVCSGPPYPGLTPV